MSGSVRKSKYLKKVVQFKPSQLPIADHYYSCCDRTHSKPSDETYLLVRDLESVAGLGVEKAIPVSPSVLLLLEERSRFIRTPVSLIPPIGCADDENAKERDVTSPLRVMAPDSLLVVRSIVLDGWPVDDTGCRSLRIALEKNTTVALLSLCDCSISDTGATYIANLLHLNNGLSDVRFARKIFCENGKNTEPEEGMIKWADEGVSPGLSMVLEGLRLDIVEDEEIREHGFVVKPSLEYASKKHGSDCNTDVEKRNLIGDIGARAIASALRVNDTLSELNVLGLSIGYHGFRCLVDSFAASDTIMRLRVGLFEWISEGKGVGDSSEVQELATRIRRALTVRAGRSPCMNGFTIDFGYFAVTREGPAEASSHQQQVATKAPSSVASFSTNKSFRKSGKKKPRMQYADDIDIDNDTPSVLTMVRVYGNYSPVEDESVASLEPPVLTPEKTQSTPVRNKYAGGTPSTKSVQKEPTRKSREKTSESVEQPPKVDKSRSPTGFYGSYTKQLAQAERRIFCTEEAKRNEEKEKKKVVEPKVLNTTSSHMETPKRELAQLRRELSLLDAEKRLLYAETFVMENSGLFHVIYSTEWDRVVSMYRQYSLENAVSSSLLCRAESVHSLRGTIVSMSGEETRLLRCERDLLRLEEMLTETEHDLSLPLSMSRVVGYAARGRLVKEYVESTSAASELRLRAEQRRTDLRNIRDIVQKNLRNMEMDRKELGQTRTAMEKYLEVLNEAAKAKEQKQSTTPTKTNHDVSTAKKKKVIRKRVKKDKGAASVVVKLSEVVPEVTSQTKSSTRKPVPPPAKENNPKVEDVVEKKSTDIMDVSEAVSSEEDTKESDALQGKEMKETVMIEVETPIEDEVSAITVDQSEEVDSKETNSVEGEIVSNTEEIVPVESEGQPEEVPKASDDVGEVDKSEVVPEEKLVEEGKEDQEVEEEAGMPIWTVHESEDGSMRFFEHVITRSVVWDPPASLDWREYTDENGSTYYFDPTSGSTSWSCPEN